MCAGTGGDYSDWYAENPEEDLLGSMFGTDATQDGDEAAVPEAQPQPSSRQDDDTFVADPQVQNPQYTQQRPDDTSLIAQDPAADTPVVSKTLQADPPPQANLLQLNSAPPAKAYTLIGHVPEYRSEIIRESKIPSQNKIELIISNQIRIKTIDNAKWRAFNGAFVSAKDNQDLTVTYTSQRTDANGSFRVVLQPADPYKFFSFVPFEETGFEPSNYTVPISAIELNTITFTLQTDEGAWHTYNYDYQVFDLRPTIDSFVNMEIRSNSRPVKIRVYGSESRYPIQDARVTIKGTAPSRLRLLSHYFKNLDLLNYALSVSPDYADNSATIYTSMGGAQFNLFYPYDYTIEISHPDYYYKSMSLNVNRNTDVVQVYLDRLFTNTRIVQRSARN
jgi:hypothetical protein